MFEAAWRKVNDDRVWLFSKEHLNFWILPAWESERFDFSEVGNTAMDPGAGQTDEDAQRTGAPFRIWEKEREMMNKTQNRKDVFHRFSSSKRRSGWCFLKGSSCYCEITVLLLTHKSQDRDTEDWFTSGLLESRPLNAEEEKNSDRPAC